MRSLKSETLNIKSEVLGEEREIYIYLPEEGQPGEIYPVIYLLDGHSLFNYVSSIVQMYSTRGRIPPMIVVGIASTDRMHDFTPSERGGIGGRPRSGGGADKFLQFLSDELFPLIESKYSTRDYRTLIGHSLGGLFTVYAFVSQPTMFRAYMALSPWFGSEDDVLLSKIEYYLKTGVSPSKIIYMAHEPISRPEIEDRINNLVELLHIFEQEGLEWRYKRVESADHSNLPLKVVPDALEFIFPGIVKDR